MGATAPVVSSLRVGFCLPLPLNVDAAVNGQERGKREVGDLESWISLCPGWFLFSEEQLREADSIPGTVQVGTPVCAYPTCL